MGEAIPMSELSEAAKALKLTFDTGDRGPWEALMAPDCVNWHNSDRLVVPAVGSTGTAALRSMVPDCHADIVQQETFQSGGEMFSIIIGGTVTSTGKELNGHNCIVLTKNDKGKIIRIDDYVDPGFGSGFAPDNT
jgi:ketosteroid isomerase-like protein